MFCLIKQIGLFLLISILDVIAQDGFCGNEGCSPANEVFLSKGWSFTQTTDLLDNGGDHYHSLWLRARMYAVKKIQIC